MDLVQVFIIFMISTSLTLAGFVIRQRKNNRMLGELVAQNKVSLQDRYSKLNVGMKNQEYVSRCPSCAEWINLEAKVCKSCQQSVEEHNLAKKEAIDFINNFISDCNSKTVLESGDVLFSNEIRFPIFYRPALANRLRLSGALGNLSKPQNLIDIYNEIKFDKFSKIGGSGFIFSKSNTTPPTKVDTGSFDRIEYVNELSSATLLGGDEIYLLAHDTNT